MYYSEYLRNKKRAAPKIISPPTCRDSSLWTQMQRYKNAVAIPTATQSGGQMLVLSSDSVTASKGHAAVCCADTIRAPIELEGTCCDRVVPNRTPDTQQYPKGFYRGSKHFDCNPVNGPPLGAGTCCEPAPAPAPAPAPLPSAPLSSYLLSETVYGQ